MSLSFFLSYISLFSLQLFCTLLSISCFELISSFISLWPLLAFTVLYSMNLPLRAKLSVCSFPGAPERQTWSQMTLKMQNDLVSSPQNEKKVEKSSAGGYREVHMKTSMKGGFRNVTFGMLSAFCRHCLCTLKTNKSSQNICSFPNNNKIEHPGQGTIL